LEHESDLVAAQRAQVGDLPVIVIDHLGAQGHAPGRGFDHRAQAFEQGTFAGTRRPDQADNFPKGDLHVHALEGVYGGVPLTIALLKALDADALFLQFVCRLIHRWPPLDPP